jgi:hypothetical protein
MKIDQSLSYGRKEERAYCLLMLCRNDLPARELPLFDGQEIRALDDRANRETMVIVDLGDLFSLHPAQQRYLNCSGDVIAAVVVPAWAAPQITRTETWRGGFELTNCP